MSNGAKIFLGICTFMPLFLGICLVFVYLSILPDLIYHTSQSGDPREFAHLYFSKLFTARFFAILLLLVVVKLSLIIYYIIHVVKHVTRSEGEKIMWILLFIFIGTIPFIIYFFLKIVPMPADKIANNTN
jgi:hypothetical protein